MHPEYNQPNNTKEPPTDPRDAILAHLEQQVQQVQRDQQARQALQDQPARVEERVEQLAQQVQRDRQALQELLARLETVVVSARLVWFHKTMLLRWMIIILVLIVLDRLLSHFPTILQIVQKLL
jgi:DNA repair exonuclease SbcCD ATPase subunit